MPRCDHISLTAVILPCFSPVAEPEEGYNSLKQNNRRNNEEQINRHH